MLNLIVSIINTCISLNNAVVNDPKRITNVVNDKNSVKPSATGSVNNRQIIQENYHSNSTGSTINVPIAATVATTSLITAGGVVGVGRPSDVCQRRTTEESKIPLRGENKRSYEYPKNDYRPDIIGQRQIPSTYGKPASLVSATMKISSATTEVYQKHDGNADLKRKTIIERIRDNGGEDGNISTNSHSTKYNVLQSQVSKIMRYSRIYLGRGNDLNYKGAL